MTMTYREQLIRLKDQAQSFLMEFNALFKTNATTLAEAQAQLENRVRDFAVSSYGDNKIEICRDCDNPHWHTVMEYSPLNDVLMCPDCMAKEKESASDTQEES